MRIAGAATEIAFECVGDLFPRRLRIVLKKLNAGQDHPGCAIAALQRVTLPKALLNGMQFPIAGQPFDRRHFSAIRLNGQERAGLDRLAIEQHRAGPADGCFAADVRAGESTQVTEEMNQEHARLDFVLLGSSIDSDIYDSFCRCLLHVVVPDGMDSNHRFVGSKQKLTGRK